MQDAKTGGCHCGSVRYEVNVNLENPVITCNCSMCGRSGTMLAFVPATEFKLLRGEDALSEYLFNKKAIAHLFCKHCGIKPFARGKLPDGSPMVAINVRCLDDVELDSLKVHSVDGKSA